MTKKTLSVTEIRELRAKGMTYPQIADLAGVSKQSIHQRLNYTGTEAYKARRRIMQQLRRKRERGN